MTPHSRFTYGDGRMSDEQTFKILEDYEHIHWLLDEGKSWEECTKVLTDRGWREGTITLSKYEYWLAYTTQSLILGLKDMAIRRKKATTTPSLADRAGMV
jgi:hypothetical protein